MPRTTAACVLLVSLSLPVVASPGDAIATFDLVVPDDRPETFALELPLDGRLSSIQLERHSLRGPGFRVRLHDASGYREVTPPPLSSYRGRLVDDPDSLVVGYLTEGGFHGQVMQQGRQTRWIEPTVGGLHSLRLDSVTGSPDTGGVVPDLELDPTPVGSPAGAACTLQLAQIAFDVDFPYFEDRGSSVPDTVANVEMHLLAVEENYARDVLITYELVDIVIRTAPFYMPDEDNGLLVLFRDEWRANHADVERDITHLMTGQPAPGLAGLAYVSVVCADNWHYGWSVNSSGVVSHEIGHNWSSGHCHDTAPCNNMCGACLYIGPNTGAIIGRHRDSRDCLDEVAAFATPLPPYAAPDAAVLTRESADQRQPETVDVLANDHDANCEDIRIASFDAITELGGTVTRDVGAGPGGRDVLLYTPPCTIFAGTDRFQVTIDDESGATDDSDVTIDVQDFGLRAYWPLDATMGTEVLDLTGWQRGGTAEGDPTWATGTFDGALVFDGVDDHVVIPALDVEGLSASFTGWLRRDGDQAAWAGVVFSRAAGTTAGLNFGTANELRYHWTGSADTYNFDSGLVVPDAAWVFVALVIEPDAATLYLDPGDGLVSARNEVPHSPQTFAGEGRLGLDPTDDARRFRGALDDWRVHDRALTPAEVEELAGRGGPAVAPNPADGSLVSSAATTLRWAAGPLVDSHDVYFGSDFQAVQLADTSSPEYRGNVLPNEWTPDELLFSDTTYAWRIDERRGAAVRPGSTWLFTVTAGAPELSAYWRLDELAGTEASDALGAATGTLVGDPTWVAGRFGSALELDGNDAVSVPALDATTIERTITLWLRRQGAQVGWAGLLFSRAGETVAGFNFGEADELRYHWGIGGAAWGWDSGLIVPDDTWVFAALVIETDRATIHLHDGTTLQSAVNVANHGLEAFEGEAFLGWDPNGGGRYFRGQLDDVRVHEGALSAETIERMATVPGRAVKPSPAAGSLLVDSPAELAWVAGPLAEMHEVYFGDDLQAVQSANTSAPEFRGRQAEPTWAPPAELAPGTYYWRIDEVAGADVVEGAVWHWAVAPRIGNSLRVVKTNAEEPELRWNDIGGGVEYEVQRCEPLVGGPCTPVALTTVGPRTASHVDTDDASPLHWYRVVTTGDCVP
ncbi:MAG: LamG-like jellyroll fold domain-containing protein [Acidobacteriota bacterium]